MKPEQAAEFDRIAAATVKAVDAVREELENDGDAHTCALVAIDAFRPEIERQVREQVAEETREAAARLEGDPENHGINPFAEIDPDDNEVFMNELGEITARWRADEITSGRAIAEIRALRNDHDH